VQHLQQDGAAGRVAALQLGDALGLGRHARADDIEGKIRRLNLGRVGTSTHGL